MDTPPSKRVFVRFDNKSSFSDLIDTVTTRLGGVLWYRGESKEYPVPAQPKIARGQFDTNPIEPDYDDGIFRFQVRAFTKGEEDEISKVKDDPPQDPYFQKLIDNPNDPGWLALARHHGYLTRLVDVTSDLRVAVYFACNENEKDDGYVFAYSQLWNPEQNKKKYLIDYRDLFDASLGDNIPTYRDEDSRNPGILKKHAKMLSNENSRQGISVRFHMPYLFQSDLVINKRMIKQNGAFIWRRDPTLSLFFGVPNIFVLEIAACAKPQLLRDLNILGINSENLGL